MRAVSIRHRRVRSSLLREWGPKARQSLLEEGQRKRRRTEGRRKRWVD